MPIENAAPSVPKKTSHKFFTPENAKITTDHEVTVKVIVGDEESRWSPSLSPGSAFLIGGTISPHGHPHPGRSRPRRER